MGHRSRATEQNPDQLGLPLFGRPDPDDEESGALLRLEGRPRHALKPAEEDPSGGPAPPAA